MRNNAMNTVSVGSDAARETARTNQRAAIRNWANYESFIERRTDPLNYARPPNYRPPYDPYQAYQPRPHNPPPPPPRNPHRPPPGNPDDSPPPAYHPGDFDDPPDYSINEWWEE